VKTLFVSLLLVLSATAQARVGRVVKDATSYSVELTDHPARIVALAPSLAELAADLLDDPLSKIVGRTDYATYPPILQELPSVGNYAKFSLEKVISLKPDLILATLDGNSKDQIEHLRELHLPVLVVATSDLNQVESSMRLVAKAMNEEDRGAKMAEHFVAGFKKLKERTKFHPKNRVLLQLGDQPLIVVGGESFLSQALEFLGAENIYADAKVHYPRPALEDVIRRNPEVIVILALDREIKSFVEMGKVWENYPRIEAVKNKKVTILQADSLLRPTLRLLDGLALLEKVIYGPR